MNKNFDEIIQKAQRLLKENQSEWVEQYKLYAEEMTANAAFISEKREKFREWAPLYFYINTSKAKNAKSKLTLDVRYMGQNIAALTCDKNGVVTISTTGYETTNLRDFDCKIKLENTGWKDSVAFRRFFREREQTRNEGKKANAEHKIESMLLTEFSKKSGEKRLRGIQPVKFAGKIRFSMPTVLSASDHNELKIPESRKGGGVDILARVGSGRNASLCIIELKDENNSTEPPELALQQAVEYTVFIRELLRSEAGSFWWKLFGFSKDIPDKLTLYASCAMPARESGKDDESFRGTRFNIDGDIIECHYIYYTLSEAKTSLQSIKTSLPQMP